jgi:pilus assembly protein CpaD
MIRALIILSLAASAAACTSTGYEAGKAEAVLPTEQFSVGLSQSQDEILLAAHASGLSPSQSAAVTDLVARWRESGGGPVTIQAPSHGGGDAFRTATAAQNALLGEGVSQTEIRMAGYDADPASTAPAPIVVGFTRYQAHGPDCGRNWQSITKTGSNAPNSGFGCANTANFAAMLANPADLAGPRTMGPPDSGRREVILGKYRTGDITSSVKDSQAVGAISSVAQ